MIFYTLFRYNINAILCKFRLTSFIEVHNQLPSKLNLGYLGKRMNKVSMEL